MKIFCVGKNYANHAREMESEVPESPVIFMKPVTAHLPSGRPFYYPDFSSDIHYEAELVIRIGKQGKNIQKEIVSEYISGVTVGIDFTARDIQKECKTKGQPWELAKSFDYSAGIGKMIQVEYEKLGSLSFHLDMNGKTVQQGNAKDMVFSIEEIIVFISKRFTIQKGDLIFTGTPEGVGSVKRGDLLEVYLEDSKLLYTEIK